MVAARILIQWPLWPFPHARMVCSYSHVATHYFKCTCCCAKPALSFESRASPDVEASIIAELTCDRLVVASTLPLEE